MPKYLELFSPTTQFSGALFPLEICHLAQIESTREIRIVFGQEIDRLAVQYELANLKRPPIGSLPNKDLAPLGYDADGRLRTDLLLCASIRIDRLQKTPR